MQRLRAARKKFKQASIDEPEQTQPSEQQQSSEYNYSGSALESGMSGSSPSGYIPDYPAPSGGSGRSSGSGGSSSSTSSGSGSGSGAPPSSYQSQPASGSRPSTGASTSSNGSAAPSSTQTIPEPPPYSGSSRSTSSSGGSSSRSSSSAARTSATGAPPQQAQPSQQPSQQQPSQQQQQQQQQRPAQPSAPPSSYDFPSRSSGQSSSSAASMQRPSGASTATHATAAPAPPAPVAAPRHDYAAASTPAQPAQPPPAAGENVMNMVFVGAECAPWSKTGGLGDVMGSLPKGMKRRGHRVMVVTPRYEEYEEAFDTGVRQVFRVFNSDTEVGYFHHYKDGVDFIFVDHGCYHGRRGGDIYTGDRLEQAYRNCLLCKAALEAVWHVPCGGITYGDDNTVFVANDWHAAVLPVYLQARAARPPARVGSLRCHQAHLQRHVHVACVLGLRCSAACAHDPLPVQRACQ